MIPVSIPGSLLSAFRSLDSRFPISIVVSALLFTSTACLDQSYLPTDPVTLTGIINEKVSHAQTFTVGTGVTLDRVEITVARNGSYQLGTEVRDLIVELQGVIRGVPNGNVVASVTVPAQWVPETPGIFFENDFLSVDFSPFGIGIAPGDQVAIVVRAPGSVDTPFGPYLWSGGQADPYGGGQELARWYDDPWSSYPDCDMGFRDFVRPF